LADSITQVNKLNDISDYLDYVKMICKDENVKQFAISTIIPYLTSRTNHYLSEVGYSFYVEFNNWLDEDIKGPGISNCTYGNLSGGESKAVSFALQMALLDVSRIQAGIFPDILLLDEILDSSVDSYGLEKILGIVKLKQREDRTKTFIVSHRKEVTDLDADRIYLIEKKDGFSHIRLQ
jgi:DNA repair exonuclease SbcCD ATPase subunit